jgi:hypothetical protein
MKAVLEGRQQGNIVFQVRSPLWTLHRGLYVRYHHPLSCRSGIGGDRTRNPAGAMVAWAIRDVGKNTWRDPDDQITGHPPHGGGF